MMRRDLVRMLRSSFVSVLVVASLALAQQEGVPQLPGVRPAARLDGDTVVFCVDERDPAHEVDRAIAEEIALALLLEPEFRPIERRLIIDDFDNLFVDLMETCDIYLGFKLLPSSYANWLALTRPYYWTRYVLAVGSPEWTTFSDLPIGSAIGTVAGAAGDFQLLQYLSALAPNRRPPRYPLGSYEVALERLIAGDVAAALVWEPWLWNLSRDDPNVARLGVITPTWLSEPPIGIGGIMRADDAFLRNSIDEAIASLVADGVIDEILDSYGFPGRSQAP